MVEYKTIEGFPVVIGECYETRDGSKAFISHCGVSTLNTPTIFGVIEGRVLVYGWHADGFIAKLVGKVVQGSEDLMRPWREKDKEVKRKKRYKLSEAYKLYVQDGDIHGDGCIYSYFYLSLEQAKKGAEGWVDIHKPLAITRADATEFYEGEGLDE